MPDLLLSELCSICHIRPHKYRCPRCSARTCSLPCIKRHKQWSQCNGIRDPALYIKRSDLTTPHGIDHDYNYLTSIERQLDDADRNAHERGIVVQDAQTDPKIWRAKGLDGPKKGEEPLRRALESCGVVIKRAPEGMGRKKQNATHWHKKKKNILWTVEWIHADGRSELGSCLGDVPIARAYTAQFEQQLFKREDEGPLRKRQKMHKIKDTPQDATTLANGTSLEAATSSLEATVEPAESATEAQATTSPQNGSSTEATFRHKIPEESSNNSGTGTSLPPEDSPSRPTSPIRAPDPNNDPNKYLKVSASDANHISCSDDYARNSDSPKPSDGARALSVHFYLHAPCLPSPRPVLIPLPPEATLTDILRSRLVLEFPTIYVRYDPPEKLGNDYILEEDFSMRMQEKEYREKIEARLTGREEGQVIERLDQLEDTVDERKLEEVLRRDLTSFQGVAV